MLILSGLWIYEASRPVYENKERNVSTYTHHGSYSYAVPVTRENPLYPVGTILQMGMPAYFFIVSPTVDMSFTYRFETSYPADISGKLQTMIVATGKNKPGSDASGRDISETDASGGNASGNDVSDETSKEKIFWKKEFPLNSTESQKTWSGLTVSENFTLDVLEIRSRVKGVSDRLNYTQDPTIEIVNRVSYTGKINGENVQGTKDFALPLTFKEFSYYQLPQKLDFRLDNNVTEYFSVQNDPPLSKIGIPFLSFLLSFILIGMTLVCMKIGKVKPEYLKKLESEEKHSAFKDYISRGKLPGDRNSLLRIEILSLQELVDTAADMNSRVIFDADTETYFMISNGVIYVFFESSKGEKA